MNSVIHVKKEMRPRPDLQRLASLASSLHVVLSTLGVYQPHLRQNLGILVVVADVVERHVDIVHCLVEVFLRLASDVLLRRKIRTMLLIIRANRAAWTFSWGFSMVRV